MKTEILSIIGYFGMIGGLIVLLAMRNLFASSPLVISLQVVADPTEGGVVTGGPYRYLRHPMYAAMRLFTSAGVAGNWSWSTGLCRGLVLASAVIRIICEEDG